jgi:hypothetical protein
MIRRTKIVATLGPASSTPEVLERMINAGVDVVRINFSHGTREEHIEHAELARSLVISSFWMLSVRWGTKKRLVWIIKNYRMMWEPG